MTGGGAAAQRLRFVAATLLTAKLVAVALRAADGAPVGRLWHGAPVVWLGQDVAVAALLYALDRAVGAAFVAPAASAATRRFVDAAAWLAAASVALAAALSVPAVRLFGTPLTWMMWHAAGGALADSVRAVATPSNVGGVVAAVMAGGVAAMPGRRRAGTRAMRVPRRAGTRAWSGPRTALGDGGRADTGVRPGVGIAGAIVVGVAAMGAAWAVGPAGAGGLGRNAVVAPLAGALRARALAVPRSRAASDGGVGNTPDAGTGEQGGGDNAPDARTGDRGGGDIDARARLHGIAAGRHIVWIVLESVHADYLGLYGGRPDPAPSVTELGAEGWVFDAAYTVYPESVKSLWALLCAAAPLPEAAAGEHAAGRRPCAPLPRVLGEHGYATSLWHSGRFDYLGMRGIVDGRGFGALYDAAALGAGERSSFAAGDRALVEAVLRHVDANVARAGPDGRRQFLMLLPASGHHPYESPGPGPRPFGETPDFRRYLSDVFMGDDAIGRLVDGFRTRGLYDETLWVVSGDHGEAFHQHPGNFAHSLRLYDENVRVPLFVSAPGSGLDRRRVGRPVSTIDIAPTILDLVGIAPAALGGGGGDGDIRTSAGIAGRSALADGPRIARFFTDHTTLLVGLRDGNWKLVAAPREGEIELFDLARDPDERRNVAGLHAAVAAAYRADLERWLAELQAVYSVVGDRRTTPEP